MSTDRHVLHSEHRKLKRTAVLICILLAGPSCSGSASRGQEDSSMAPRPYSRAAGYKRIDSSSFHLSMSDGTRIAVNLHLPASLEDDKKIPAILHQTRYWRSLKIKFPARWFVDGHFVVGGTIKKYFVQRGYA